METKMSQNAELEKLKNIRKMYLSKKIKELNEKKN